MRWSVPVCVALVCALFATPLGADDEAPGEPIVLTNEDIERFHGPEPASTGSKAQRAGTYTTATSSADPDRVADSWQEEYYRLKAQALQRALDRGERIELTEASVATLDAPPAKAATDSSYSGSPTCLYGRRGSLIFAPEGTDCRENRRLDASRRVETAESREHVSCLYGIQGEVLHQPPGRICPRRRQ